jgi:DNA helicase INO80
VSIKRERNGHVPSVAPTSTTNYPIGPPGLTIEATEEAFADIERADMSDIDIPGFEGPENAWRKRSLKRMLDIEQAEHGKRKVCRIIYNLPRWC